jgi:hypothetical protein
MRRESRAVTPDQRPFAWGLTVILALLVVLDIALINLRPGLSVIMLSPRGEQPSDGTRFIWDFAGLAIGVLSIPLAILIGLGLQLSRERFERWSGTSLLRFLVGMGMLSLSFLLAGVWIQNSATIFVLPAVAKLTAITWSIGVIVLPAVSVGAVAAWMLSGRHRGRLQSR